MTKTSMIHYKNDDICCNLVNIDLLYFIIMFVVSY